MPSAYASAEVGVRLVNARAGGLFKAAALCAALMATVAAVSDDGLAAAQEAYAKGRFLESAELAEALGTSAGQALAARCLAFQAQYIAAEDDKPALVARALALADEAIRLDPDNADAYLQSARALGLRAGIIGNLAAFRQGLGGRSLELVSAALERAPDHAEAHLGVAGWHADVVAAGFFARATFKDANKEAAVRHYERALEMAGDSKAVRLEYARRLPKLDRKGGRERARALLSEAAAFPVGDFYDGLVHEDVLRELAALK